MNCKTSRTHGPTVLKHFALAALILIGILASCGTASTLESCDDVSGATSQSGATSTTANEGALVRRVVDGDTIEMADGARVRYIGIDAPERDDLFYQEATDYNRQLVEGQRVHLLRDESDEDRFGRLLRYILAGDILINAELVREGFAIAKRYPPDEKFADCFDDLMHEAKENRRGLWER